MNFRQHNTENNAAITKLLGIAALLLFLTTSSSFGQNTKGDRAEVGSGNQRQTRFKPKHQKAHSSPKPGNRRITPHKFSIAKIARYLGVAQGSRKNVYSQHDRRFVNNKHQKPGNEQKAWRGGMSEPPPAVQKPGKRSRNVYTQRGSYFKTHRLKPSNRQKAWRGSSSASRFAARTTISSASNVNNIYSKYGQYASNPSPKPKDTQKSAGGRRRITPRSASSSFIHQRTLNSNAGFWNVKKKSEVAVTTDIAGRPLRAKNYQTPSRAVIAPSGRHYSKRKRIGDRPYKGSTGARYVSATKTSPKAWTGDITGRKIRGRNFNSNPHRDDNLIQPFKILKAGAGDRIYRGTVPGKGNESATEKAQRRRARMGAVLGKAPGIGVDGLEKFQGNLIGFKPIKGGGSRSGKLWNNKGSAILGKQAGVGSDVVGSFQGNLKGYKPIKGGGSVSGRLWNNKGVAIHGNQSSSRGRIVGSFQGNVKAYKPPKGGGSVSGKLWNNKQTALSGWQPSARTKGIGIFQGNVKAYKPPKGGGSISGRLWNNKENALSGWQPSSRTKKVGIFQGNLKARKHLDGGGSVSGRLWNNDGNAVQSKQPGLSAQRDWTFHGNIKTKGPLKGGGSVSGRVWNNDGGAIRGKQPGLAAQGDWTFHGNIKARKPLKGGGSISGTVWNNKTKPILVRIPPAKAAQIEAVGETRLPRFKRGYIRNDNAAEAALKKKNPHESTYSVDDLQIKLKRRDYVENKNSSKDALRKLEPTKSTLSTGGLQMKVKQYDYVRNSSSAHDARNVREPGKAFARSSDYQGNIKMKKFDVAKLFSKKFNELHPDAKFVKINKNNVADERDFITNIKLWWARNFRKSETQPDHLKEKEHKPRYDKGEQGLWND